LEDGKREQLAADGAQIVYRRFRRPELGQQQKKEPPLPAAQELNREASNRVDRSHSMSRRWTFTVMKGKA
jgi:hypothetical protein